MEYKAANVSLPLEHPGVLFSFSPCEVLLEVFLCLAPHSFRLYRNTHKNKRAKLQTTRGEKVRTYIKVQPSRPV